MSQNQDCKINCESCHYFDGSKHEKDKRTEHAGICKKWYEVTFKTDVCKYHFSNKNLPEWEQLTKKQQTTNQLTMF